MKIERLKQTILEDHYSRSNISHLLRNDLIYSNFDSYIEKGIDLVSDYRSKEYWDSKNKRVEALDGLLNSTLVNIVFIAVMTSGKPQPYQGVATKIAHQLKYDDIMDGVRTASELLAVLCQCDAFDIIGPNSSATGSLMIKSNLVPSQKIIDKINHMHYMPPMICEPLEVTNKSTSGHLTVDSNVVLKEHNKDVQVDNFVALNIANQIAFSLDENMLGYEEELKEGLTPDACQNALIRTEETYDVIDTLLEHGNKFYFTHKYDARFRMYSQGYHINYQSDEYRKSLINLHTKEIITQ